MKVKKEFIELLACIVSGPVGLHNIMNKEYKKAIMYFLTVSGFGLWYIADIIKIAKKLMSSDKPNNVGFDVDTEEIKALLKEVQAKKVDELVKKEVIEDLDQSEINMERKTDAELYLESFKNIEIYDMKKILDDEFMKKLNRVGKVEYEKFIKPIGTTKRPTDFVVFDLETTGLKPAYSEIIEIGAIRFRDNKPVEVFHTYIKPEEMITEKITSINGISNEMVKDSPGIEAVMPRFIDFIGEDVLIAHNSNFDMGFILENIYNLGYKKIKNKAIDTLKLSRQKVREFDYGSCKDIKLQNYKLENLKFEFGLSAIGSHNAVDDCKTCAYVYMRIINSDDEYCYVN